MATLGETSLSIRRKRYPGVGAAPPVLALEGIALTIKGGEFVCLAGPSGCGKTTLLNILSGLDRDFEGSLLLPTGRRKDPAVIGYVFQEPRLLPWRTVRENLELVIEEPSGRAEKAASLIAEMGLHEFSNTYPTRLSLGMARRVALARAFAVEPDLLLLDEPFVSLDEETAERLRRLLLQIWRSRPVSVVCVTHNLREAVELADRIIVLSAAPARILLEERIAVPRGDPRRSLAYDRLKQRLGGEPTGGEPTG